MFQSEDLHQLYTKHGCGTTIYKAIWREKGGGGDIKFGDVIDAISEGSDIIYSKLKGI